MSNKYSIPGRYHQGNPSFSARSGLLKANSKKPFRRAKPYRTSAMKGGGRASSGTAGAALSAYRKRVLKAASIPLMARQPKTYRLRNPSAIKNHLNHNIPKAKSSSSFPSPIVLLGGMILMITLLAYLNRSGNQIAVHFQGREIQPIIEKINSKFAADAINFLAVDNEAQADVSITFQDDIGIPNADAISYTFCGKIFIANSAPEDCLVNIIIHEILHCAGIGHETDDPSSVMYLYSQPNGQVSLWQKREIKRLAGISGPERLIAQIRIFF